MKHCAKCQQTKPLEEYYIRKGKAGSYCKGCQKQAYNEWIARNPDKYKQYQKEYHAIYDKFYWQQRKLKSITT